MIKRLIIVVILLAIVIGGVAIFFSRDPNPTKETTTLSARLTTLVKILDEGSKNAKDGNLRDFTSETRILVLGEQASITAAMAKVGVTKVDKVTTTAEADEETFKNLTNAALSGYYDASYRNVLSHKLDNTVILMREVKNKTPNAELKAALTKGIATFTLLQDKLAKL